MQLGLQCCSNRAPRNLLARTIQSQRKFLSERTVKRALEPIYNETPDVWQKLRSTS